MQIDAEMSTWNKGEIEITTKGYNHRGVFCNVFTAEEVLDVRKIYIEKQGNQMHMMYIRIALGYRSEAENAQAQVKAGQEILVKYPTISVLL